MADTPTSEANKLGPVLATALVAGMMIGSGIFLLPARLAGIGGVTIFSWIICAIGTLFVAGTFAGLAIVKPSPEGMVDYARQGLGRYFGFQSSLAYWVGMWTGNVAIALAVVGYLAHFVPVVAEPIPGVLAAIAVIWFITLIALVGPRFLAKYGALALALGLVPVCSVAFLGWFWFDPAVFHASWNISGKPASAAVMGAIVSVFWAYQGLEAATVAAAVVRRPERNIPIAVIGGLALATLVYVLACTAIMGIIPARELHASTAPFALAVGTMFGAVAAGAVAVCAMMKASGTLGSCVLVTAETTRSSSALAYFPRWLAKTRADGTPVRALLVMGVIMSAAVFLTRSDLSQQFELMIDISVVLTTFVYGYCCVTLFRLSPTIANARGRMAARICAVLGGLFCIGVIVGAEHKLLYGSLIFMAATIPLWALYLLGQKIAAARIQAD